MKRGQNLRFEGDRSVARTFEALRICHLEVDFRGPRRPAGAKERFASPRPADMADSRPKPRDEGRGDLCPDRSIFRPPSEVSGRGGQGGVPNACARGEGGGKPGGTLSDFGRWPELGGNIVLIPPAVGRFGAIVALIGATACPNSAH